MKHAEVTERRRTYRPELLEALMLGEDCKVCPRRKTSEFVDSDSISVVCRCNSSFCFRCGMEVEDIDPLEVVGHWTERDGCRRSARPGPDSKQQDGDSGVDGFEEEESSEARPAILCFTLQYGHAGSDCAESVSTQAKP